MTQVRLVHAGDISTSDAHALTWNVGEINERYQEIAIADTRVIGSWTYSVEWYRRRARIQSGRTDVTARFQRKGIASRLWFAGIARWAPDRIQATIATDEGRDFLARMLADLAYQAPNVRLWVKTRAEDTNWDSHCDWHAKQVLNRLGERDRTKQIEAKPQPKLLKGAA